MTFSSDPPFVLSNKICPSSPIAMRTNGVTFVLQKNGDIQCPPSVRAGSRKLPRAKFVYSVLKLITNEGAFQHVFLHIKGGLKSLPRGFSRPLIRKAIDDQYYEMLIEDGYTLIRAKLMYWIARCASRVEDRADGKSKRKGPPR